jgi:L,D-peptidoglycan transpeptidase YkuD (ErfK/YbiS/YcfS/YnhG family)
MHPYVHQQLITERQDELARVASRVRPSRTTARHQMRENAGWLLVHVGLRLALGRDGQSAAARPA